MTLVPVGIGGWGVKTCLDYLKSANVQKYALIDSDDHFLGDLHSLDVNPRLVVTPSTRSVSNDSWTDMYFSEPLVERAMHLVSRLTKDGDEIILFHSLGGTTGSALSARICEDVKQSFPLCVITCFSLLPIRSFSSSHVNCTVIAGLAALIECVDGLILIDAEYIEKKNFSESIAKSTEADFRRIPALAKSRVACFFSGLVSSADLSACTGGLVVSASTCEAFPGKSVSSRYKHHVDSKLIFSVLTGPCVGKRLRVWTRIPSHAMERASIEKTVLEEGLLRLESLL